jgi:hypothetical protein
MSCINDNARIFGDAHVTNADVYGQASVSGEAKVFGNSHVSGSSIVTGTAKVAGYARITEGLLEAGFAKPDPEAEAYTEPIFDVDSD